MKNKNDTNVVDEAVTPDGIKIQLKDFTDEYYLPDYYGMIICFQTIAKNTFPKGKGWYAQKARSLVHVFIVVETTQKICSKQIIRH